MNNLTFENLPSAVAALIDKVGQLEHLIRESRAEELRVSSDALLTVQQTAQLLDLTVPTIYGLVQRAAIPHSKRGKRLYFSKQELTDWVKQGRRKTQAELTADASEYINQKRRSRKP